MPSDMTTPAVDMTKPTKTDKQTRPRRLQHWEPDTRWSHPVAVALWLYTLAVVVTALPGAVPVALLALVAPVGIALSVTRSRRTYPELTYGTEVAPGMAWLGGAASVIAAGWLIYAALTSPWQALPALALAAVFFGGFYAVLRHGAPKAAAEVAEVREEQRIEAVRTTWQTLLEKSGLDLKVIHTEATRAGYVLGVEPVDGDKPVNFATLQMKLSDLTTLASAALAREGIAVRAGSIRAEETEAAHVHLIHVCTAQILRESIDFEPFEGAPGTIADPLDFGLFEDGQPLTVTFGGEQGGINGKIVGATGSGKSRVLNSMIGRVGECGDALVGVIASSKLVPAVYPWLKPWIEGKTDKPAIDFVAGQDPDQVLLMLAAIYLVVRERNAALSNESTHTPSPEAPAVVLFIEESGDMPGHKRKATTHDGREVTFSELVDMLCREDRSAQVSAELFNQMDLFGAFGEFGSEIARNTPFRICLRTMTSSDGPSVLPGLTGMGTDTTKLLNKSMLVQPSIEEPRIMPAKAYNLGLPGGNSIEPIAIRNAAWRPDLEPELVEQLGDIWTGRWDAARLPELAAAAARDGLVWPVGVVEDPLDRVADGAEDDIDRELRKWLDTADGPITKDDAMTTPPETTPTPEGGWPDVDSDMAELKRIAEQPKLVLPEPLASIISLLTEPQAKTHIHKDFISTRQLAVLLQRVPADASDDELTEAAAKLGRELSKLDDELRTEQRKALRGYDVNLLRRVAMRIARSGQ